MAAQAQLVDARGVPVQIGSELGRGGEGAVFELRDRSALVAKLYLAAPNRDHAAKLAAMVSLADERTLKLAAWPTELVFGSGGAATGFLMPKVSGFRPAFELYGPKLRLKQFPTADWRFLIRAASNTARAFDVIHAGGHVMGDVNHGNLMVGQDATVRLIDCDSFQISTRSKTWFCTVGVPTHQPPEMQGMASYAGFIRTPNHDAFGLAVLIFQMLCLARHPYSGRFLGSGDPPSIEDAIKGFRYAYGGDSRITQMAAPPGSLPMDALTPQIRQLFDAAFLQGGVRQRPMPSQWIGALNELAGNLRQCSSVQSHYYLSSLTSCPWCRIEALTNTPIFPVVFVPGSTGADGFMLLWQQAVAVRLPGPRDTMPVAQQVPPSGEATRLRQRLRKGFLALTSIVLAGWLILWALGEPWASAAMVALPVVLLAMGAIARAILARDIRRNLRDCEVKWQKLRGDWSAPPQPQDPTAVRADLDRLKGSYDRLQADRAEKLRKLHEHRKASQMEEYLDRFQIAGSKVRGVGAAKAAVLQSYGIETAADVVFSRIITISGFGPKTVQNLVDWRTTLERSFRFDAGRGVAPVDVARVENAVAIQRRVLEQNLSAGLASLRSSIAQELMTRDALRGRFGRLAPRYAQASADGRAVTSLF